MPKGVNHRGAQASDTQTIWYLPSSPSTRRNASTACCRKGWASLASNFTKTNRSSLLRGTWRQRGQIREEKSPYVQLSGVYLLLGENTKRVLAAEVYQPEGPLCGQAERPEILPVAENLNANRRQTQNTVIRVVRGWINYHGISDNKTRVGQFIYQSRRIIYRWFNCKGCRHPMTWEKLDLILKMLGYPSRWRTLSIFHSR